MAKKGFSLAKAAAWALGLFAAGVMVGGIVLKVLLPPEKIRKLVVSQAALALRREVRLREVSVGVLRGLSLEGLEVSENPDFKAGKFLSIDKFVLRIDLLPLLHKSVVVDEIAVEGPAFSVVKDKKGRFNFDDLAAAPAPAKKASEKTKAVSSPPLNFALKVRKASLSGGRVSYADRGAGTTVELGGLEAVATSFNFDQATGNLSVVLERLAWISTGQSLLNISGPRAG